MNSPAASSSLPRILLGSLIGAAIGLVLLALGLAILWKALDARRSPPRRVETIAATAPEAPTRARAEETPSAPYPVVAPGAPPPAVPADAPPRAADSAWRSIFDDADEVVAPAPHPAPHAAPSAEPPRPATRPASRPTTPRRPPEAQRQDDSLFF